MDVDDRMTPEHRRMARQAAWFRGEMNRRLVELDQIEGSPALQAAFGSAHLLRLRADIDTYEQLALELETYLDGIYPPATDEPADVRATDTLF